MLKSDLGLENKIDNKAILKKLSVHYPQAATSLNFDNPFQLLVATVLSAQTTDQQVNRITNELFKIVSKPEDLAAMQSEELEPYLKSCGLYRHKSRYLIAASKMLLECYGGKVPESMEELIKLPGVGRKTANVILSSAFGIPALAVDTHVFRVSKRLGLAAGKNVERVEEELREIIPEEEWRVAHHWLIAHGRQVCHARNPRCSSCFLMELCLYAKERGYA